MLQKLQLLQERSLFQVILILRIRLQVLAFRHLILLI